MPAMAAARLHLVATAAGTAAAASGGGGGTAAAAGTEAAGTTAVFASRLHCLSLSVRSAPT